MTVKVPEKSKVVVGTHFASIDKEVEGRHTDTLGNTGGPGEAEAKFSSPGRAFLHGSQMT